MTNYVDPKLVAKALARVTKSTNIYYSSAVKKIKKIGNNIIKIKKLKHYKNHFLKIDLTLT